MTSSATDSGFAQVNGTRLYYEARGSGPALLLLHGYTLDRRMWEPQVDALGSAFRVVAYDARGFGRSALPIEGTSYRHCEDAAALCEHLGLQRVVAVGHSIGAHQLLELALTRPDLVAGWGGIAASGLASVPFPEDVLARFGAMRQAARDQSIDAAKRIWSESGWFTSARESPALAQQLDRMLADYSGWHFTHDNPAKGIEPPAAQRLAELRMPALVLTGARDLSYNDAVADALLAGLPRATAVRLEHAGHMANLEAPTAVTTAIARLVRAAQA